ncbi:MAG: PAS domain-containing protein [Alphaproteobacteria bacterium]|nr:PAS domain-containing protein [Alphaproteobacteria bacterium]
MQWEAAIKIDPNIVLAALPDPVLVVDQDDRIAWVNAAAESFFGAGSSSLREKPLAGLVTQDSPLIALLAQVRAQEFGRSDHGVELAGPRIGSHRVDLRVLPMEDTPGRILVCIQQRVIAESLDRQLAHQGAARSVVGMASLLAHEVKNPLSGIRGAAQLLEQNATDGDAQLTKLICDETDRICALIDDLDKFGDERTGDPVPVNLHEILNHVKELASSGFARDIRFVENFDPSIPDAAADRNSLIQVFLNLIKNAAEAAPAQGGEITLATAYRHGVRVRVPGADHALNLPLQVTVTDNGSGIPEDLEEHLFDAFVTTKADGSGLGLALVAKLVRDHGGVVEFDSEPRRTVFTVRLPVFQGSNVKELDDD